MRGHVGAEMGPTWAMQKHRALAMAGCGVQRAPGDSMHGLGRLLPPGLGRRQRVDQASGMPSPFTQQMPMDEDLHFVAEMMVVFDPRAHVWRERQRGSLRRIMEAIGPVRASLQPRRSGASLAAAADRDVAGIAFFTAALRWSDRSQAEGYLKGFKVFGEIESSRIFREVRQPALTGSYYGQAAMEEVRSILAPRPPKEAAEMWKLTQEEASKGFTEPLVTAWRLGDSGSCRGARTGWARWSPPSTASPPSSRRRCAGCLA